MSENKEMTALEYFEIKKRMTKTRKNDMCNSGCSKCGLSSINNGFYIGCGILEMIHPERAAAIVQKWAEEHPQKTILQDFLERFPKASINNCTGVPRVCTQQLGYIDKEPKECGHDYCTDCWNRPLEVEG